MDNLLPDECPYHVTPYPWIQLDYGVKVKISKSVLTGVATLAVVDTHNRSLVNLPITHCPYCGTKLPAKDYVAPTGGKVDEHDAQYFANRYAEAIAQLNMYRGEEE